jgi:hypothetical protein
LRDLLQVGFVLSPRDTPRGDDSGEKDGYDGNKINDDDKVNINSSNAAQLALAASEDEPSDQER